MMTLTRLVLTLLCSLALMPQLISQAQQKQTLNATRQNSSERRIALIIGNSAYALGPLANPVNDARDLAATLRQAQFEVLYGENQNRRQMRDLIRQFGEKLRHSNTGLFYFAGHGVQVNDTNFLIPIGAEITKETEIEDESVSVNFVLAQMEEAQNTLNIVILDACRDNPFARSLRSGKRGLAVTRNAPTGTLIAYATAAGSVARDGEGRNGLFTQELLTNLKTPGLTLEHVFRRTRTSVRNKSSGQQVPYEYTSVEGEDFYFLPPNGAAPFVPKPAARVSVIGVPLTAMSFVTAQVATNGNVMKKQQGQCYGFTEDLGNGTTLEMVEIPGGTFLMGSTSSAVQEAFEDGKRYDKFMKYKAFMGEKPQHQVRINGFAMSRYEVTQAQWRAIMGNNPAHNTSDMNLPVEQVNWAEAQEFCRKLSERTERHYRLPTEAEWEYAARAGTTTAFAFGKSISVQIANYDGNYPYQRAAKGHFRFKTVLVGSLGVANRWGLFDMHGNVWEWCEDVWHESYEEAPSDGSSWTNGGDPNQRVIRGGAWDLPAFACRAAIREGAKPDSRDLSIGFRVVAAARSP
ncbi:MAG TPA: SUMF1/EgtB/PvdO family nonheme iron enzyme [Blastocatellia bacterium]|nr:SUMF1/EgtB/PvdO family nonheme iron enzyme [Blastocatellia bacterium]